MPTEKTKWMYLTGSTYLPKYFGRYKNSLIFINGESINYRRLTVYELKDKTIKKHIYEMDLCSNRNSIIEHYLFFYNNQPIKIISYLNKTLYQSLNLRVKIDPDKISSKESCSRHLLVKLVKGKCYSLK